MCTLCPCMSNPSPHLEEFSSKLESTHLALGRLRTEIKGYAVGVFPGRTCETKHSVEEDNYFGRLQGSHVVYKSDNYTTLVANFLVP